MSSQKIVLFTNSNEIGKHLAEEAMQREHSVTMVVDNGKIFNLTHPNLRIINITSKEEKDIIKYLKGQDVVICLYDLTPGDLHDHVEVIKEIVQKTKKAGIKHIVIASHVFTNNEAIQDIQDFKVIRDAHQEIQKLLKKESKLSWSFIHSAEPEADKNNQSTFNKKELVFSQYDGETTISIDECVSTMLDEAEGGQLEMYDMEEDRED
jgi:putative NADH-flavin reductase